MSAQAVNHPLLMEASLDETSPSASDSSTSSTTSGRFSPLQVAAFALASAGLVALAVGWFGVSDKVEVWEQIPYLLSGGLGGAVLVGLGLTAYVAHEHAEDRRASSDLHARIEHLEGELAGRLNRRLDELEMAVAAELDELTERMTSRTRP